MGKLQASCIDLKSDTQFVMTLSIQVVSEEFQNKYTREYLYELWNRHPVIDCVGYVTSLVNGSKRDCLVFIQLSLQKYRDHTRLSEVFRKQPTKQHLPKDMVDSKLSLFLYYLKLCEPKSEDMILFMYISPEETEELSLLQSIRNDMEPLASQCAEQLKNTICFGTLAQESPFYSEMNASHTSNYCLL